MEDLQFTRFYANIVMEIDGCNRIIFIALEVQYQPKYVCYIFSEQSILKHFKDF